MNYNDFKEILREDVRKSLQAEGIQVKVKYNNVEKINDRYEAMIVTPVDSNVGFNISISEPYDVIHSGVPYSEVLAETISRIKEALTNQPEFDLDSLTNYSYMKERLIMEVVSFDRNQDMLKMIPHQILADLAVVYRFALNKDEAGQASILVTNQILEQMGVTPEQLYEDAMENAPRIKPAQIRGMSEVLAEMMGFDQAQKMGIFQVSPEEELMYVATVPGNYLGASVLAYRGFMDQAAEKVGGSYYVLPSSINEIILLRDGGMEIPENDLKDMVRQVNGSEVDPREQLSDNAYHYDATSKIFETVDSYILRKKQAQAV